MASEKLINYVEARAAGLPPKKAAEQVGLSPGYAEHSLKTNVDLKELLIEFRKAYSVHLADLGLEVIAQLKERVKSKKIPIHELKSIYELANNKIFPEERAASSPDSTLSGSPTQINIYSPEETRRRLSDPVFKLPPPEEEI
jgi:hypothetical protein